MEIKPIYDYILLFNTVLNMSVNVLSIRGLLTGDTTNHRLAAPRSPEMADVFRYVARRRRDVVPRVDAQDITPAPAPRLAALHLARNKPSYNSYIHRGGWGGGYGK